MAALRLALEKEIARLKAQLLEQEADYEAQLSALRTQSADALRAAEQRAAKALEDQKAALTAAFEDDKERALAELEARLKSAFESERVTMRRDFDAQARPLGKHTS